MRPMARRGPDFKVYTIMIASLAGRRHFPPGKGGVADSDGGPAPSPDSPGRFGSGPARDRFNRESVTVGQWHAQPGLRLNRGLRVGAALATGSGAPGPASLPGRMPS